MSLAATLSIDDAADRVWDVMIVGAGPAGALAARQLARLGNSVLLVDKASFPRAKVCGSCLNLQALSVLEEVGLGDLVERNGGIPLTELRLVTQGQHAQLPLPGGAALSRPTLDTELVRAAIHAGAVFLPNTRASLARCLVDHRELSLQQAGRKANMRARLAIAADGLAGGLLDGQCGARPSVEPGSRVGAGVILNNAPDVYAVGTIYMAMAAHGYVGLVRVENGSTDIAAAFDPEFIKHHGGLGPAAERILNEAGMPEIPGLANQCWRGTPALTRRSSRLGVERTLVLGDAAGYVEPFTGEGIAWALTSAAAIAPIGHRAVRKWDPSVVRQWARRYRETVARRQIHCRIFSRALRHPKFVRTLVRVLAMVPAIAVPWVRSIHSPKRKALEFSRWV